MEGTTGEARGLLRRRIKRQFLLFDSWRKA